MLGLGNARLDALEAANRVLRVELLAQTERVEALSGIVKTLRRENEALARQCTTWRPRRKSPPSRRRRRGVRDRGGCAGAAVLELRGCVTCATVL